MSGSAVASASTHPSRAVPPVFLTTTSTLEYPDTCEHVLSMTIAANDGLELGMIVQREPFIYGLDVAAA